VNLTSHASTNSRRDNLGKEAGVFIKFPANYQIMVNPVLMLFKVCQLKLIKLYVNLTSHASTNSRRDNLGKEAGVFIKFPANYQIVVNPVLMLFKVCQLIACCGSLFQILPTCLRKKYRITCK